MLSDSIDYQTRDGDRHISTHSVDAGSGRSTETSRSTGGLYQLISVCQGEKRD